MKDVAELVLPAKAALGEGPCWDSKKGVLYWVNILGKTVNIYDPKTNENKEIHVGQQVGTVVPRESGGVVVAMQKGFYFLDSETEQLTEIVDPEEQLPENRFNDGKCDPYGRFWAGTLSLSEEEGKGSLYCLHSDFNVEKKVGDLTISNGLAWSPDHRFMYLIDTPTRKVTRFDYDGETGAIDNPVPVIEFKEGEGFPDGMTIDEEGMLWIAHWNGAQVSRWNPETGEQLTSISVPALNVTSCTFGGPDLKTLYITTARKNMTEEEWGKYPLTGGLFKVETDVKGSPAYSFGG
ncbi:SMP-30/gluconolactonase/LRE family protein [Fictibacillus phosphorivorans]|uniref:SMP-30/gluconolactonase/LRE family protein n=1 Tax=Fictibacillus phosphorivorans TaxID=1221500 RepID=UPI00203D86E4|nr:SMP-30/gluconolactonase/LRE family protein [Fictibacillus phosphorivorans]MCM3776627.1 SMP-30/gluconolactonase/LRE family protein [Fictibacillus phosphorivorans]